MAKGHDNDTDSKRSLMDRRSYLGLTAAAVAGTVGVGQAAAADYETIEVPAGSSKSFNIAPGETMENKLIDITADGAGVFFDVKGTLRNVGIKGEQPADKSFAHVCAPESDGEVLIENVYAGDGTDANVGSSTAWWVDATGDDGHRGTATFRNVHTAGFHDNAIYASGPGTKLGPDEGGETHVESCFSRNNNISNFRIGTNGSYVKDSVAVVPEDASYPEHPNGRNARGVRAIEGATEMLVENCDIHTPGFQAVEVDGHCTVRDTSLQGTVTGNATTENVDENVDKTPPSGVPMSAEEAASGSSSGGDAGSDGTGGGSSGNSTSGNSSSGNSSSGSGSSRDSASGGSADASGDAPHGLSVSGGSPSNVANYRFQVSDQVEKTTARSATIDDDDTISDDGSVSGGVAGGTDSYRFSGELSGFSLDGDAAVYLDDQQIDPSTLAEEGAGSTAELPNLVVIVGTGASWKSQYEFTVDGEVEKTDEAGSIDERDEIAGTSVSGAVDGGVDAYRYSGSVTNFRLDGTADVRFGTSE